MPISFQHLSAKVLEEAKRPLSANEIWEIAQSKGYDKELSGKGKTPWATLGARLYVDVRDNPQSIFVGTGTRPKRFILRSLVDKLGDKILDVPAIESNRQSKLNYLEQDLHPFLVYFGFYHLRAYLKTIRHTKSSKKEFGEWVHPDIVGCYFPFNDWKGEVVEVSALMGNTAIRLFSFELKRELSISNLREAFFQAVSNSSWANEGYLVAAEIETDEDFRSELERLSASFGVGVIRIDVAEPDSTEIILPARPREAVDWETVNKLAGMNKDFQDFLRLVKDDITIRKNRKEMYDPVLDRDELVKSVAKKK